MIPTQATQAAAQATRRDWDTGGISAGAAGVRGDQAAPRGPGPPGTLGEEPGRRVAPAEQRGDQAPGRGPAGRIR